MVSFDNLDEDRVKHMLGTAKKAYELSKNLGYKEEFAEKMFVAAFLHDIGYAFSEEEHEKESVFLINLLDDAALFAIEKHGKYADDKTVEWKILNSADLQVSSDGRDVGVVKRLDEIKEKYGEKSDEYLTSCDVAKMVGLTFVNMSGSICGI